MAIDEYRAKLIGSEHEEGNVKVNTITGAELDQSFVGKFLGRQQSSYNRMGKILELIPVLTDPNGLWLATVRWGVTPDKAAETERVKIPFSMAVDIVEIAEG
ncbi:hypothetical protein ACQPZ2_44205 (plasmid) [Nocardia pseudovaccinii]|uniref:hypothetical protein n=1 Tax=Nocardia pseudovaccinii TaxID=189540 RepID=UPI003D92DFAA